MSESLVLSEPISPIGNRYASPESTLQPMAYADLPGSWYVISARPNYERRVNRDLENSGLTPYLPLVQKRQLYPETPTSHGGWRTSEVPLFSRYLFCLSQFDDPADSFYRIKSVDNCSLIFASNQERLRREIRAIENALQADPSLTVRTVAVGDLCTINGGPFMGFTGYIVKMDDGKHKVSIKIEYMSRWLDVPIDESLVEKVC